MCTELIIIIIVKIIIMLSLEVVSYLKLNFKVVINEKLDAKYENHTHQL